MSTFADKKGQKIKLFLQKKKAANSASIYTSDWLLFELDNKA
jgi:hypothetical protein